MSEAQVEAQAPVDVSDDLDAFSSEFFGEKSVESPPAKVEAEQVEQNDEADASVEAQDDADDDVQLDDELPPEVPKKKTVQDRINEVIKQREDAKREADKAMSDMRKEFEAKLAALNPQKPAAVAPTEPTPDAVNEDGSPKYALGEFDPAFIRDLTRHTLNVERAQAAQEDQKRQIQAQEQAKAAEAMTNWNAKIEKAVVEMPDLREKGQVLLDSFSDLDTNYAGYLAAVLQTMEHGPEVLYYLSNNPAEARTIVNSGAQRATLALGRIEAKYADAAAQKQVAKPKISNAPPPAPVGSRGTGGGAKTVEDDTDDLDAFSAKFFADKKRR